MGWKGPDRSPAYRPTPAKAYSVGEMLALGWIVRARCKTCWKVWPVNLQAIVKAKGARTTLWDQEQSCPRAGCGQVVFQASTTDTAQMWDLIWDRRGSWQAPLEASRE